VAAVNRVGFEGAGTKEDSGIEFWGSSFVSDPFGQIMSQASVDKEEILIAECDPSHQEQIRQHWPFLRDRRIDAYGAITSRWIGK
jgi:N-carbamoylputrescine amidase